MATRKKGKTGESAAKPPSKAQLICRIAEKTQLSKSQIGEVFSELELVLAESIDSFKQFTLPGLLKISVARKAATAAHPGRNPRTGEEMIVKAKPARNVIRVRALKHLKDMVL